GQEEEGGLPGAARVAVRHVGGALLVAHEDELDLGVDECVEHRHRGAAREAKDVLDALAFEALDQLFATRPRLMFHHRPPKLLFVCSLYEKSARSAFSRDRKVASLEQSCRFVPEVSRRLFKRTSGCGA